jgi:hypothetical protein
MTSWARPHEPRSDLTLLLLADPPLGLKPQNHRACGRKP